MEKYLYAPPVIFVLFLALFAAAMLYVRKYAASGKDKDDRSYEPYAGGERNFPNYVNPSYTQFFRYAFVFSIMHVLALVVASAPSGTTALPLAYIAAGILSLAIIFRK